MRISAYRICNEDGKHVLTVLPCLDPKDGVDIVTPDGEDGAKFTDPKQLEVLKFITNKLIGIKTS